jgi:hypothetical protein
MPAKAAAAAIAFAFAATLSPALAAGGPTARPVPGTDCPTFPADSWFHADISDLPVHRRSAAWMKTMSSDRNLHPDFGPSYGEQKVPYGIPITVVDGRHDKVKVRFRYASQSDRVRYPLGDDTKVEGGQYKSGDRHTVVIDRDTCRLYETWATARDGKTWSAGSGAVWDLESYDLRPDGWTSADAAGLPIMPLLLRWDLVSKGKVDHAIRFTTDVTDKSYLWPARHQAGSVNDPDYPPMGARFRLKKSYEIKGSLRADTKAVLEAMQRYGLVLADNGSPWYFQGTSDERWPEGLIEELKQIPASAFEAVDTSSLMISEDSMRVRAR